MFTIQFNATEQTYELVGDEIVEGVIEDAAKKPELPADVWIEEPVDCERAWAELERSCRGG